MTLRASRRGLVPPFIAMDVLRAANAREAAGERVIHLEVGQPGTPAPKPVRDAARRALDDNMIGYTDAAGIPPLRAAIAADYRERYGVAVDPAEIFVTTGSSAAFQLAFLAAFEPGDRVALAAIIGEAMLFGRRDHRAGRGGGAGDDEPGDVGDVGQKLGVGLVMRVLADLDQHGFEAERREDVAIGRVARRRERHPVARLERGEKSELERGR